MFAAEIGGDTDVIWKLAIMRPYVLGTMLGVLTFGAIYLYAGHSVLTAADRLGKWLAWFVVAVLVVAYVVFVNMADTIGGGSFV